MDDPVLVEAEEDDFWFRGFNMRTGERGVFPAFYAHAVPGPAKDLLGEAPSLRVIVSPRPSLAGLTQAPCDPLGSKRGPCWVERFDVQFLGSVEVPCHQGNGILCAAMQKVSLGLGVGQALQAGSALGGLETGTPSADGGAGRQAEGSAMAVPWHHPTDLPLQPVLFVSGSQDQLSQTLLQGLTDSPSVVSNSLQPQGL